VRITRRQLLDFTANAPRRQQGADPAGSGRGRPSRSSAVTGRGCRGNPKIALWVRCSLANLRTFLSVLTLHFFVVDDTLPNRLKSSSLIDGRDRIWPLAAFRSALRVHSGCFFAASCIFALCSPNNITTQLSLPAATRSPPTRLAYVPPLYPPSAAAAHIPGAVILELLIDTHGTVADVNVVKDLPQVTQFAVDAVRHWIYEPTIVSGAPRSVRLTVVVRFPPTTGITAAYVIPINSRLTTLPQSLHA
jgi:TonB family protein